MEAAEQVMEFHTLITLVGAYAKSLSLLSDRDMKLFADSHWVVRSNYCLQDSPTIACWNYESCEFSMTTNEGLDGLEASVGNMPALG